MQAAQPEVRFSGASPEQAPKPVTRLWKYVWNLCIRFRILFYFLAPMAVYVDLRARHWHEGFLEFLGYHFIEMVAIYLALAGIGFAARHDLEMRTQTKGVRQQLQTLGTLERSVGEQLIELNSQMKELKRIEDSLSTQRKGPFPQYLSEIERFVTTAKRLDILLDCLDYGSFFVPEKHQQVHNAICAAASRKIPIRLLVCGKVPEPLTGPSGLALDKFGDPVKLLAKYLAALTQDTFFGKWICTLGGPEDRLLQTLKETWLEPAGLKLTAEVTGRCADLFSEKVDVVQKLEEGEVFQLLLQLRQLWFALGLRNAGVQIRAQNVRESLFFWVKYSNEAEEDRDNDDDALFTLASAARGPVQLGFNTHDPDLLTTFRASFEKKWKEADPTRGLEPWLAFLMQFAPLNMQAAAGATSPGQVPMNFKE